MRDAALRRRLAEAGALSCPSCGREAMATATGQCIHCLQPLHGLSSRIEPERILRVADLERSRGRVRGAEQRRRVRLAGALMGGVTVALMFLGLFGVVMRWLTAFFARGIVHS